MISLEMEARLVKKLYLIFICILSVVLTGCMKKYPLSETQTDIVAEYMASRLLEKDKAYSPTLLDYQETTGIDEVILEEELGRDSESTEKSNTIKDNEDDSSPADSSADHQHTLSEVIGEPSFYIQYESYQLTNTYPEDETNLVFSLDPREGQQLLVINFIIENITDGDKIIDLSKTKIQYQLDINGETTYKPQLALLENNLQYIKLSVDAGAKIPAVLIFEVAMDIDISDINLKVSNDEKAKIVEIK